MHKYKSGKSKPEWKIAITLLFGTNIKTDQERVRNGWGHPVGLTGVIRHQLPGSDPASVTRGDRSGLVGALPRQRGLALVPWNTRS